MLLTLMLSSVVGALVGLAVIASQRGGLKYALPFGTFPALAALFANVVGDPIVNWYIGLY
jgi:leader peptidase (prepilin peptidase)/N-methyltransferase